MTTDPADLPLDPATTASAKPESELAKAYDPRDVEPRWYAFWLEHDVFAASDDPADTRPVYALPMPPPNVTGSLHMGHALTNTIEDVLVRYHRMRGYNTLWQPGIDHAGIATQTVVERILKREGKTRQIRNAITMGQGDGMQTLEMDLNRLVSLGYVTREAAVVKAFVPAEID